MTSLFRVLVVLTSIVASANLASAQWVLKSQVAGSQIECLAVEGTTLFAGSNYTGMFRSTDYGTTWKSINDGLNSSAFSVLAVLDSLIFAGAHSSGMYVSSNNGDHWTFLDNGIRGAFINSFAHIGSNLFVGTDYGVYKSTNNGVSGVAVDSGMTDTYVCSLCTMGTMLFAGTQAEIYRSTDSGATWTVALKNDYSSWIGALAVSGKDIFAGGIWGAFVSADSGKNWTHINNGLSPSADIISFAVKDSTIYAGTDRDGVYLTTNNGTSWVPYNNSLTDTRIMALAVIGNKLFAGSGTGKVWELDLPTSIQQEMHGILSQYMLSQNYPNPFNPSTTITFSLPRATHVTLDVYNTLGQQVAQLVNGNIDPGYHEIQFNASNLASGVYFYRIQAGSFVDTKTLLLIR